MRCQSEFPDIGLRELVEYREFLLVGAERCGEVALRPLRIADLLKGDGTIALPAGVGGIGLRQAADDLFLGLVRFQRAGEVSLRHEDIADPFFADADVILPLGVGGVAFASRSPMARSSR